MESSLNLMKYKYKGDKRMELEKLKRKISEEIINSHLKIDCVYYVLKDIFREIEETYYLYLKQEEDKEKGETK